MAGDYHLYQRRYGNLTTDVQITALTSLVSGVLVPRNSSYRVYLQKAFLMVTTFSASVVKIVGHTSGLVFSEWTVPAAAPSSDDEGITPTVDFGPLGLSSIPNGESLDVTLSAVGVVGYLHIEGYQKLEATISATAGAAAQ